MTYPLIKKAELIGNQRGFSTLEILIAMTIMVFTITSVLPLVFGSQSVSIATQTNQEALYKAQAILEDARATARQDFNSVNPMVPTADNIYQKSLSVQQIDFYTKQVTGIASWQGENNKNLNISLTTLITNPKAVKGGDTCSSVLMGNWKNPVKKSYEFGSEIIGDSLSSFPITSIQAFENKLYVATNNNHENSNETFFILDISNPAVTPLVLGKLDNSASISDGLNAVAVDGHYAYVANAYDSCTEKANCAQLQIIDISVPSNPNVVTNLKIDSFTGSGQNKIRAAGTSIFYKNGIVYLGLANANNGNEFYVIDVGGVSASPTSPVILKSFEIESGVNAIFAKGNYVYVASPDVVELKILDVSRLGDPQLEGSFDAPGGGGNNGNGKSIAIVGNTLYLGRTLLSGDEFYILDNTNPETNHQPPLGSKNIQNGSNSTSVNGIIIRDFLAFLITNREFQTWKINDPSNITQYANPLTLPSGSGAGIQRPTADCEGNYIYVGSQGDNDKGYISVITSSP